MIRNAKTLFIIGPTASGKSALAMQIAKELGGEIICADSRTIYKGLDIATAKPTAADRVEVPHWGLDFVEPNVRYSAADFKDYAVKCINDIQNRGKLPIVVGGTGLYIDGLLFDFSFGPAADPAKREELERLNVDELQQIIATKGLEMPENAKNKRYLIRAIEQGGINRQNKPPKSGTVIIGLNPGMPTLEQRIKDRAQDMLKNGALKEAQWLFTNYGYNSPATSAPFFKAFAPHFTDVKSTEDCLERYILNDRQLAKRQIAWFKRNDHIHWFEDAGLACIYASNFFIDNNNNGKNSSNTIPV